MYSKRWFMTSSDFVVTMIYELQLVSHFGDSYM
jgi:hypothetical protein